MLEVLEYFHSHHLHTVLLNKISHSGAKNCDNRFSIDSIKMNEKSQVSGLVSRKMKTKNWINNGTLSKKGICKSIVIKRSIFFFFAFSTENGTWLQ